MLKHCVHYDSHMPTIQGVYNWVLDININFHVMHAQREDYDSFIHQSSDIRSAKFYMYSSLHANEETPQTSKNSFLKLINIS